MRTPPGERQSVNVPSGALRCSGRTATRRNAENFRSWPPPIDQAHRTVLQNADNNPPARRRAHIGVQVNHRISSSQPDCGCREESHDDEENHRCGPLKTRPERLGVPVNVAGAAHALKPRLTGFGGPPLPVPGGMFRPLVVSRSSISRASGQTDSANQMALVTDNVRRDCR